MKAFIDDDFLLQNKIAQELYHETARELPVIDYHNHLNPAQLASDHRFYNLAELWVIPDQYKHRAMRISGVPEAGITGLESDKQKFLNWARIFPKTLGNPLFHWSCLELKHIFGIDALLNEQQAESIWQRCNESLQQEGFTALGILKKWRVELLCTSDDLLADLQMHIQASRRSEIGVLPSLRGDTIVELRRSSFPNWLASLETQTGLHIDSLEQYQLAIQKKLDHFQQAGCLLADHALDAGFVMNIPTRDLANALFQKLLAGALLSEEEYDALHAYLLVFLGKEYALRAWKLQLHIGAQRQTSTRLRRLAGGAGGFAAIGKATDMASLVRFLDTLEQDGLLPKVILYTLNPMDNEAFASLTGSFAEDGVAGKLQFGPAWWYNDHYDGVRDQLVTLANYSLLPHAIGMTTDSRSLLSFSRHDYYRRVLCNLLGEWAAQGRLPMEAGLLHQLVSGLCYENAKNWITDKRTIHVTENARG